MASLSSSVPTLTPESNNALREILGYLNFSNGTPDVRFQRNLNLLSPWFTAAEGTAPIGDGPETRPTGVAPPIRQLLSERLVELQQESPAFKDCEQAQHAIQLIFDHAVPAYREFHADLLFHVPAADFWQPFFTARVAEAVLAQGGPWAERDRIVAGAVRQLNDFLGHRPVAVLETGQQMQPYSHERFRPLPLYLRGAGASSGRYSALITAALETIGRLPADFVASAYFDPAMLDEIALDVRAYDHSHPVYKRTNYTFGEWDPHCLDVSGRYRRFVLRSIILDSLLNWMQQAEDLNEDEKITEAAAVLAGTMLMASAVSGSGPDTHHSTVSLTTLLPKIARQRDAFYAMLLESLPGKHGDRLRREAKSMQQPFGRIRQHLNLYLAHYGCRQMQRSQLAYLFARMGHTEAARHQAAVIPAVSVRFETEIQLRLSAASLALDRGQIPQAVKDSAEAEALLHRGIACGGIVDPWNILGFQGQFPLFSAREDAVPDPRVDKLLSLMEQLFSVNSRLMCEAAASGEQAACDDVSTRYRLLAEFWDKFATTTVADLPSVSGQENFESAAGVSRALAAWHKAGEASGDVSLWKQHLEEFQSPRSYSIVIDLLLRKRDTVAAMNLLIQWLSQSDTVPLESGAYSFFTLMRGWLSLVLHGDLADALPILKKFFDYLEANAGEWWATPTLERTAGGQLKLTGSAPADQADAGREADDFDAVTAEEPEDDEESLFSAAYENVVYRDSAQDGNVGDTVDEGGSEEPTELDLLAGRLEQRIHFLVNLAHSRQMTIETLLQQVPEDSPAGNSGTEKTFLPAVTHWQTHNETCKRDFFRLAEELSGWEPPEPQGDPDSLIEYDRHLHVKFSLLHEMISACVTLQDTSRLLRCLLPNPPAKTSGGKAEAQAVAVLRALARGDRPEVLSRLPGLLKELSRRPLLYVPVDREGKPREILAARSLQSLIRALLSQLPRLGLLRETWHVLRTAYLMERTAPPSGMSVTEFDRLLEAALDATLTCLLAATSPKDPRSPSDEELVVLIGEIVEIYMRLWLKHSATMRISSIEGLKDAATWRKVKAFIKKYGGDLFHPRMLTMGNLRGIVQLGAEAYLDYLAQEADPLHPIKLLEDIENGTTTREEAAHLLELILRCVVEKFDRFMEYNTTTTQSDYGEQLYCLLDFLRLEVEYERQAWNMAPLEIAHEVLSREGRTEAAALWCRELTEKTAELSKGYVQKLKRLEKQHGIRLPSITDRLSERFVKPLALDRILALVKPSMRELREGQGSPTFTTFLAETEDYLSTTSGSALDLQPWLQNLTDEVQQSEAELLFPEGIPTVEFGKSLSAPDLEELQAQLKDWEKPLEDLPEDDE